MKGTRLRDHSKWDLALAAVTLSVTAVAAGSEVTRWVSGRFRGHHDFSAPSTMSKRPPSSRLLSVPRSADRNEARASPVIVDEVSELGAQVVCGQRRGDPGSELRRREDLPVNAARCCET